MSIKTYFLSGMDFALLRAIELERETQEKGPNIMLIYPLAHQDFISAPVSVSEKIIPASLKATV